MLLNTIDDLRQFIPVDANMNFETVSPFISDAQDLFIKPLLGDYYDILQQELDDEIATPGTGDPDAMALLPYVQRSLANYVMYLGVEHIGVSVGEMGIQQQSGQNSQPAPRWKVQKLQLAYLANADRFADLFLEYLEENATAMKYAAWFADPAVNTSISGVIVHKTKIAAKYIDINDSRRVFLRLKRRILEIEQREVKRLVCTDQYAELISQLMGVNPLTAENQLLIEHLEPFIAKRALYLTMPSLSISISHEGITMYSSNDSVVMNQAASAAEKNEFMKSLRDAEMNGYEADKETLTKFIEDNIADYPLIEASACWTAKPDPGPKFIPSNDQSNSHFSV